MNDELGTAERIMQSAVTLMQDKGFKSVTIKDIAALANVSEMTVFRHFETKKGVLEAAVKKYSYIPKFQKIFAEMSWNLTEDLVLISKSYMNLMEKNKALFLIAVQERKTMPELTDLISVNIQNLKSLISDYFSEMQNKNLMKRNIASSSLAYIFITMNYGHFVSMVLWDNTNTVQETNDFIENMVNSFCNGIAK